MIYKIAILFAVIAGVVSSVTSSKYNDFIQKYDKEMPELVDKYNNILEYLAPLEDVRGDLNKLKNLTGIDKVHGAMGELSTEARNLIHDLKSEDETLQEKYTTPLQHIFAYPKFSKGSFNNFLNLNEVKNLIKNRPFMCNYNDKTNCSLNYYDVEKILASSKDVDEIEHYWLEWKDGTKVLLSHSLTKYCALYISNIYGHALPLEILYFSDSADNKFINHMDKIMGELKPYYQQFHAYLRSILKQEYGDSSVTEDGKIRHHVFEAIYQKTLMAYEKSILEHPKTKYFQEQNYTPKKFAQEADLFFKSMGFETLSEDFWSNHFTELDAEACRSEAYVSTPNIYLKYCPNITYTNYITMHSDFTLLHYANQKKNLPFSFYQSYDLDKALSNAVELSVMSSNYKQARTNNSPEYEYLFVKYFIVMMTVPQHYINSKILFDRLYGNIKMDRVNDQYWKLMDKHMGIVPPVLRKRENLDLPISFYDITNSAESLFFKNIVEYQIYEGLCEKASQYDGADPTKLCNCDFHGSTKAGASLKEMMQLGSTKPWQQVLSTATGNENGMSVEPLIHYYSAAVEEVRTSNERERIVVPWEEV